MNILVTTLLFCVCQPHFFAMLAAPAKLRKVTIAQLLISVAIFTAAILIVDYLFARRPEYFTNSSGDDESACKYVSSRGLLKSCDVKPTNPVSSIKEIYDHPWEDLKPNSTVYIHGSAIPAFVKQAFPRIKVPFILVSGDCDETIAEDVFENEAAMKAFLEDSRLIHWYSQNATTQHPKITIMPIGLGYHAMFSGGNWKVDHIQPTESESALIETAKKAAASSKKMKCYGNFHFQMGTRYAAVDRKAAMEQIPKECIDYEEKRIDTRDTWANQAKYEFVASPHGNGYDCHRTWEALTLGVVPIVKTSPIDRVFDGLPVVIVKEWSDITPEFLKKTAADIKKKKAAGVYNMERLTLKYWVDRIKSGK